MQFLDKKEGETQKNEYFQTQWRKHVDKLTIPPKQTPVYLAVSKGRSKEKKHRTGEKSTFLCVNKFRHLYKYNVFIVSISSTFIHTG